MDEEKKTPVSEIGNKQISMDHSARFAITIVLIVIAIGGVGAFSMAMAHRENKVGRNFNFAGRTMMGQGFERGGRDRDFGRGGMMGRAYARAGLTGTVTAISGNNLTVKDSSGKESAVVVSDTTSYAKAGAIAKQSDLATNNVVTVAGSPNSQGQIVATAVRIW